VSFLPTLWGKQAQFKVALKNCFKHKNEKVKVHFSTLNDFQPSTIKPVKKHPSTIKTGQIWSSAGFKSGFLFF